MPKPTSNLQKDRFFHRFSSMIATLNRNLRRLFPRIRWPVSVKTQTKNIVFKELGKSKPTKGHSHDQEPVPIGSATVHPNRSSKPGKPIRVATFNAALFSMAPALPKKSEKVIIFDNENNQQSSKSTKQSPKGILKQSPMHPNSSKFAKSKLRVSINLPDNEISLKKSGQLNFIVEEEEKEGSSSKAQLKHSPSLGLSGRHINGGDGGKKRTILEVLKELNADILAMQDVKAEEEKGMEPLSELAAALGMTYVFAESWAPEYGNAILSKWPIKRWKVQKIFDNSDFRNVLKATIDIPEAGEVNFQCTHLDHLDENWRMKQVNAIIQSNHDEVPHILAGGLNSLDETDYSTERWTDIVKYYEEMGKPKPKTDVMRFLKGEEDMIDAKNFAGECEAVVMIAKGQSIQGTCKYGTRVDYILASPDSPYKFVPGSYSVISSKGTSDHHIVKVDIVIESESRHQNHHVNKKKMTKRFIKNQVVKITNSSDQSKGIWSLHTDSDR
ncbi:uncharacterized protein LOC124940456 [Impatiens glandulifera]|uniref:uncharacterized protein LOC124940456 n=1 Tax=Impatiens glandulifera TaxID=253017 RepID=UPI001FB0AD46|nr:uncharacterized protein LOC124940456 [Impatiens glandulifera]